MSTIPNKQEKAKLLQNLYLSEGKFKYRSELASHLASNILYYEPKKESSGLIVVNKPAGVPSKGADQDDPTSFGLVDVMPEFAALMNVDKATVVKSVQRYASGCVILSTKEQGINQVKNALSRQSRSCSFGQTFLALTYGVPRKDSNEEVVDYIQENIRDETNNMTGKRMSEPVISRILKSQTSMKKKGEGAFNRVSVTGQVLSKSQDGRAALYRIESSTTNRNFINVYCADMLSPVLGDELFSYRVSTLLGKMVRVSPQRAPDSNAKSQTLPAWFLDRLGLHPGQEGCLPLHLHLSRVHLPSYFGANRNLTINAPLQPYFLGSADGLGIDIPNDDIVNDKELRTFKLVQTKAKKPKTTSECEIIPPPDAV
jgi:23S rRNA-/tRNA-specific pseudouridylate synthase